MDVRYTAEQRALRDSAAAVVDRLGVHAVGELDDGERSAKLDAAVVASGWRELRTAADDGGAWATAVEVAIVAEELARGLADTPFLGPTLAVELRRLAAAPDTHHRETVMLRPDLVEIPMSGDSGIAIDAGGATTALLVGRDGTLSVVHLDGSATGVDLTRPSVAVDARPRTVIGTVTADDLLRCSALALATTTADLVGSMQGALDLTVEYAKERKQYGRAIGSFQAVAHLLADALVHLEGSRTALLHAAWAVDALEPADALTAAASAKAYAARAAREVCETAVQVHGGIGNTWECLAHLYLRRVLLSTDVLGGVGPNLDRVLMSAGVGA